MMLPIETQCADELADVLNAIQERGEDPMLYLLSFLHGYLEAVTEGDDERVPFIMDLGGTGLRIEIIDDMDEYEDEELVRVH
ncbi:MAG: hypothetical protein QM578_12525 [Pantoea sp.]|uniref:hypothetical protein n=1 Tax=Pantoea sp. TaxID=69393 RepID=UPI0039E3A059